MQIQTTQKGFEAFECKFEPFESKFQPFESKFEPLERYSKYSNLKSNHSKGILSIRMQILTIWKGFTALEIKF